MTVTWTGKAVSVNKWHVVRRGRIAASREYETFITSLAWAIKAAIPEQWAALDLTMQCDVGPLMDDHNLLKPVCDAVERSGLLANDREIKHRHLMPATRHKRGQPDTIRLELKEKTPCHHGPRCDGRGVNCGPVGAVVNEEESDGT